MEPKFGKWIKYVKHDYLRTKRIFARLSHKSIGKLMGMSAGSYFNLECGHIEPKISDMIKIAEIFKEPISNFFNLEPQESQSDDGENQDN